MVEQMVERTWVILRPQRRMLPLALRSPNHLALSVPIRRADITLTSR
jgi:hypothetical protein